MPLHGAGGGYANSPFRSLFHDPSLISDVVFVGSLVGIEPFLDFGIAPELQRFFAAIVLCICFFWFSSDSHFDYSLDRPLVGCGPAMGTLGGISAKLFDN